MGIFLFWLLFLVWTICSLFLILIILNQEPKGGGVGGVFAQGSAIGDQLGLSGMQQQLRVVTRTAAIVFFVLSILLSLMGSWVFQEELLTGEAPAPAAANSMISIADTEGLEAENDLGDVVVPISTGDAVPVDDGNLGEPLDDTEE
jgi:protein translocase SecG subunit